jgi:hypothetical protein
VIRHEARSGGEVEQAVMTVHGANGVRAARRPLRDSQWTTSSLLRAFSFEPRERKRRRACLARRRSMGIVYQEWECPSVKSPPLNMKTPRMSAIPIIPRRAVGRTGNPFGPFHEVRFPRSRYKAVLVK